MIEILNLHISVWITLIFLLILSVIDLKTYKIPEGAIPAFLTVLFILLIFMAVGYPQNIQMGLFAFLIALALSDLGMFYGLADLKVLVAIGMTFPTIFSFMVFLLILSVTSLTYKFLVKKYYNQTEIPFIPMFLIAYILDIAIGTAINTFI